MRLECGLFVLNLWCTMKVRDHMMIFWLHNLSIFILFLSGGNCFEPYLLFTLVLVIKKCYRSFFLFPQWRWCSVCTLVKRSGLWLAAGSRSRVICKHGSHMDLLRSDSSTGLTAGPGKGEMTQKNFMFHSTSSMYLNKFPRGCLGAGHQTPSAQKEAAAGSAGPGLRGGR